MIHRASTFPVLLGFGRIVHKLATDAPSAGNVCFFPAKHYCPSTRSMMVICGVAELHRMAELQSREGAKT